MNQRNSTTVVYFLVRLAGSIPKRQGGILLCYVLFSCLYLIKIQVISQHITYVSNMTIYRYILPLLQLEDSILQFFIL